VFVVVCDCTSQMNKFADLSLLSGCQRFLCTLWVLWWDKTNKIVVNLRMVVRQPGCEWGMGNNWLVILSDMGLNAIFLLFLDRRQRDLAWWGNWVEMLGIWLRWIYLFIFYMHSAFPWRMVWIEWIDYLAPGLILF